MILINNVQVLHILHHIPHATRHLRLLKIDLLMSGKRMRTINAHTHMNRSVVCYISSGPHRVLRIINTCCFHTMPATQACIMLIWWRRTIIHADIECARVYVPLTNTCNTCKSVCTSYQYHEQRNFSLYYSIINTLYSKVKVNLCRRESVSSHFTGILGKSLISKSCDHSQPSRIWIEC